MVTYKNLYSQVDEQIQKRLAHNTKSPFNSLQNKVSTYSVSGGGSSSGVDLSNIITAIQDVLSSALPARIVSGLTVEATSPISSSIVVKAGSGSCGGTVYTLTEDLTIPIPLETTNAVYYINLYLDKVVIDTEVPSYKLNLAKIIIPNPGTTTAIQDTKDTSWNAYIVNQQEYKLHGDAYGKFEEDTVELLRDNIGDILADNLIGNLRLSENLKITNTQGSLELNSDSLKLFDISGNNLAKFNQKGVYFYNDIGIEMARFTNIDSRIGNILVTTNSLQSTNFLSGSSGFRIRDSGDVEFNNLTVRGTVYALAGDIGGIIIESDSLHSPNYVSGSAGFTINSSGTIETNNITANYGYIGGIEIAPQYIQSDNFVLGTSGFKLTNTGTAEFNEIVVRGTIYATVGEIGGFTIEDNILHGGVIQTARNVGLGNSGVAMDSNGLRMYDSVLGLVVNLPSNGDAPIFSSGIINSTIFNINTNAIIRTSETVGDGSSLSYGILVNNTGIYGCAANQTLDNANFRISAETGNAYFSGTLNSSAGNIGSVTITENGLFGGLIQGSLIRSPEIESSESYPKIRLDYSGLSYQKVASTGAYGEEGSGLPGFLYGDGTLYGSGMSAALFNENYPMLSILSESELGDVRLFNRGNDPTSGTHEIGDLIVTNGKLKLCTVGGTPGTFQEMLMLGNETLIETRTSDPNQPTVGRVWYVSDYYVDSNIDTSYSAVPVGTFAPTYFDTARAQSFTLNSATSIKGAAIHTEFAEYSYGKIVFRIETDNSGEPSGVLADANLEFYADIITEAWINANFTPTVLPAGTYWLVISFDADSGGIPYLWIYYSLNGAAGKYVYSTAAGWSHSVENTRDLVFKIYSGVNNPLRIAGLENNYYISLNQL